MNIKSFLSEKWQYTLALNAGTKSDSALSLVQSYVQSEHTNSHLCRKMSCRKMIATSDFTKESLLACQQVGSYGFYVQSTQ